MTENDIAELSRRVGGIQFRMEALVDELQELQSRLTIMARRDGWLPFVKDEH